VPAARMVDARAASRAGATLEGPQLPEEGRVVGQVDRACGEERLDLEVGAALVGLGHVVGDAVRAKARGRPVAAVAVAADGGDAVAGAVAGGAAAVPAQGRSCADPSPSPSPQRGEGAAAHS
jgi:hypothetical protein